MNKKKPTWKKIGLISTLSLLQACGPKLNQEVDPNHSTVNALTLRASASKVNYFFAFNDLEVDPSFEGYEPRTEWLKLVGCRQGGGGGDGQVDQEAVEVGELEDFTKLSQFNRAPNCKVLKVRTLQLIKPEGLAPGGKSPLKLDLGNKSPGFLGGFSRGLQQILMPVQALSSLLWVVYIYQMVKNDPSSNVGSISQAFKSFIVNPVKASFRLLGNSIVGSPLSIEKFIMTASQTNEAKYFSGFLEGLAHPQHQVSYAKDMAMEFKAFLNVNRDGKFLPKFLQGIKLKEFEAILLDKEKSKALSRVFLEYREKHKAFDLTWFRTHNEWLIKRKKLNPFSKVNARDLEGLNMLIGKLQKGGSRLNSTEELAQAKRIYLGLRSGKYRVANKILMLVIWVGVIKISWDIIQNLLQSDSKVIVSQSLSNQFRLASLNVHQNIKNDDACTAQMKRGIDIFDRKAILKTVVGEGCGNLISELNHAVLPELDVADFGSEDGFLEALEGVRILSKTMPDLYELTFETKLLN